jgi:hypothetical protein
MDKKFDIFIGRIDGWHTYRAVQAATIETLNAWLAKGYRIETKHQIGWFLHEVYLVDLAAI